MNLHYTIILHFTQLLYKCIIISLFIVKNVRTDNVRCTGDSCQAE